MLASEYFLLYRPLLSVSVKCLLNIYYVLSMVVSAKDRKMRKTNVAFAFLITDSFKIVLFISIIKLSDHTGQIIQLFLWCLDFSIFLFSIRQELFWVTILDSVSNDPVKIWQKFGLTASS